MKDDLDFSRGGAKVDPTSYPQVKCDKCGHNVFRSALVIYNVSGLAIGTGAEDFPYPLQVYVCDKCGTIIKSVRDELDKIEKEKIEKGTVNKPTNLIL